MFFFSGEQSKGNNADRQTDRQTDRQSLKASGARRWTRQSVSQSTRDKRGSLNELRVMII